MLGGGVLERTRRLGLDMKWGIGRGKRGRGLSDRRAQPLTKEQHCRRRRAVQPRIRCISWSRTDLSHRRATNALPHTAHARYLSQSLSLSLLSI